MASIVSNNPRTVEDVFRDFKGRRNGLIKALTVDVEDFFLQCDPAKENLCLYGFPDEHWEVSLPAGDVPPQLPEPVLGINFARDGMIEKDWLALVAAHSDAWLLSVAFYFGARYGFGKSKRELLFNLINELPTVYEVVPAAAIAKKQMNEKSYVTNPSISRPMSDKKPSHTNVMATISQQVSAWSKLDLNKQLVELTEQVQLLCTAGNDYVSKSCKPTLEDNFVSKPSLEDTLQAFMQLSMQRSDEIDAQMKIMSTQIGQLTIAVNRLEEQNQSGKLLSDMTEWQVVDNEVEVLKQPDSVQETLSEEVAKEI